MPLRLFARLLPWVFAGSLAGVAYAASHGLKAVSALSAASIAIAIAGVCLQASSAWTQRSQGGSAADQRSALRNTTRLSALVYAWAALALFVAYTGAGPVWQHGWQYGSALAVIAAGLALYVRDLGREGHWVREKAAVEAAIRLAILHGVVSGALLVWLIGSGKLKTLKGDWAANHVFIAVTATAAALSLIAVRTHKALGNRPSQKGA